MKYPKKINNRKRGSAAGYAIFSLLVVILAALIAIFVFNNKDNGDITTNDEINEIINTSKLHSQGDKEITLVPPALPDLENEIFILKPPALPDEEETNDFALTPPALPD